MEMLVIDGIRYKLWTPKDEEKEFHPLVRKCYREIFGEDSLYFDVKHILKAVSGIGSIPDAYVINLSKSELCVVEVELASHPLYDHIVRQLTKFINGIENPEARNKIIDMLYDEINKDAVLRATVQKVIDSTDVYRFVSKLLSKPPRIVIVVDQITPEIEEACKVLRYQPDILEFRTFVREDAPNVQAHLFKPLYKPEIKKTEAFEVKPVEPLIISREELSSLKDGMVVICPSKPDGVNFLLRYEAWGFVRIRKRPQYFALYISHPESRVSYFGEVKEILEPKHPESPITEEEARHYKTFREGKKIITLKPETLKKLDKGISKGTKRGRLQGLKYTTLSNFINARTLDDL